MFILTSYIAKHEYKPLDRFVNLDDLLEGAKKVLKGLAVEIKSPRHVNDCRFFKVRIGKKNGARMIVFVMADDDVVPILIRLKKDKMFGMNMAMNNQTVVRQIGKNLDHVRNDISKHQYKEFDL